MPCTCTSCQDIFVVGLIRQTNHAALCRDEGSPDLSDKKRCPLDCAVDGIRVNAICPAVVRTPMLQRWAAEQENLLTSPPILDRIHPTPGKAMSWPIQKGLASMRTSRREFLQTSALASLAAAHSTSVASDGRTAGISTDAHLNASE